MTDDQILGLDDEFIHDEEQEEVTEYDGSIIGGLDIVVSKVRKMGLTKEFWDATSPIFDHLTEVMNLTKMQVLIVGTLVDEDESCSWTDLARIYGISRIKMMNYADEIQDLVHKQWIRHNIKTSHMDDTKKECFGILYKVVSMLRQNKPFVPDSIDNLTLTAAMKKICSLVNESMDSETFADDYMELAMDVVKANRKLEVCKKVLEIKDKYEQYLLLYCICKYTHGKDAVFHLQCSYCYFMDYEWDMVLDAAKASEGTLFEKKYVVHGSHENFMDADSIKLSKQGIRALLKGYKPAWLASAKENEDDEDLDYCDIIKYKSITPHQLFFNKEDLSGIEQLKQLLENKAFMGVQKRLQKEGRRKGVACLFYGAPGTGKTELAKQISLNTKRDIMQVDISRIKDKYVGESEKGIKQVFSDYRDFCKNRRVLPILLFNECDAIISKRTENVNAAVDKMENAIQNIILQELEDLEGIVICTTNLTTNIDKAFERRFLFKLEFHKPNTENKAKIISSMMPYVSDNDARTIAENFDLSGGQIENIARKSSINYILSGKRPDLEQLKTFCNEEQMNKTNTRRIGFSI